MGQSYREDFEQ